MAYVWDFYDEGSKTLQNVINGVFYVVDNRVVCFGIIVEAILFCVTVSFQVSVSHSYVHVFPSYVGRR